MIGNRHAHVAVSRGVETFCRAVLVAAVVFVGIVALPTAAGACSCAEEAFGPPKVLFEGRAVEVVGQGHLDARWSFDVTKVIRGEVADPQEAEVATGGQSACGLQTAPVVAGALYEVGAYPAETANGGTALYVTYCGGSLRQLQAAPPTTAGVAVPIEGPAGPPAGWVWAIGAAVAVGGTGLGYIVSRRRASGTFSRDGQLSGDRRGDTTARRWPHHG